MSRFCLIALLCSLAVLPMTGCKFNITGPEIGTQVAVQNRSYFEVTVKFIRGYDEYPYTVESGGLQRPTFSESSMAFEVYAPHLNNARVAGGHVNIPSMRAPRTVPVDMGDGEPTKYAVAIFIDQDGPSGRFHAHVAP